MRFWSRRTRVLLVATIWLTVMMGLLFPGLPGHASSEFTYGIDLNYRLETDSTATVTTKYRVTNASSNRILASIQIDAPTSDVHELAATYADGRPIATSMVEKTSTAQGYNYQYDEINLKFVNWPGGRGAVQDFVVTYKTSQLVDNKGNSKTFSVPSLSQVSADENYHVSVSVPQSFGKLFSTGAMPTPDGYDGNRLRYAFPNAADLKRSVALIFGDTTIYKVDFAYPLKNTTGREQIYTVTLPPDTSSQKIFINKLDPAPVGTRLDPDGNVLADYRVPAKTTITVHTDISAQVKYLEYDLSKSGTLADIPADIKKNYTTASQYWQTSDVQLQSKVRSALAGTTSETKVIDLVRKLQQLTDDTLTYNNEKIKYNIRQGSSNGLKNPGNAVCLEYSDLMVAMLRSQGIPARMPVGYAYAGSLKQSKSVVDSLHSWVEAYIPGLGWINVDPTWSEKFDNFGKSDLDHFAFALWGRSDALPAAVTINGQDQNYQYEQTTISYADTVPAVSVEGQASLQKYALFPGVSLVHYQVTAPKQVAGDQYSIDLKQGSQDMQRGLGSLAPNQTLRQNEFYLGWNFSRPADLTFLQQGDTGVLVLATASARVVYWPMAVSFGILAGAIVMIGLRLSLRRKRVRIHQADAHAKHLMKLLQQQMAPPEPPAPPAKPGPIIVQPTNPTADLSTNPYQPPDPPKP